MSSSRTFDSPTRLPSSTVARRNTRRRRLRSVVLAGTAAIMLAGSTGCSLLSNAYRQVKKADCLDDFMIAHRNKVFAAKAWYREQGCFGNRSHLTEFKAGFLQGYADVANGSDGCLPCVAPSQYWGWKYQSPGGQAAIDAWFAGYPLGVKAAEQDGVGHWSRAPVMERHATTPQTAAPGMSPIEASLMLAPDGTPITDEIIVPGSTKIIETTVPASPFDLEDITPPTATATEASIDSGLLDVPALGDGASISVPAANISGSGLIAESEYASTPYTLTSDGDEPTNTESLVPRQSATVYSLGDMDKPSVEIGDDAIESIFGSIEMPNNLDVVSSDSTPAQSTPVNSQEANRPVETAGAVNQDIPFKFE
ncbi:MAG: hypothetical protein KDB00_04155 [Planctomycetales bacterium]|nr:hypothetical protein [Planctomycetales bacterium]